MRTASITERQQQHAQDNANWRATAAACIDNARAAVKAQQIAFARQKLAEARVYLRRSVPQ